MQDEAVEDLVVVDPPLVLDVVGEVVPQLEVEVEVDEGLVWRVLDEGLVHRWSYEPFVWVLPLGIDLIVIERFSLHVAGVHNVGVEMYVLV